MKYLKEFKVYELMKNPYDDYDDLSTDDEPVRNNHSLDLVQELREICLELIDSGFNAYVNEVTHGEIPAYAYDIKGDINIKIDIYQSREKMYFKTNDIKDCVQRIQDFILNKKKHKVKIFVNDKSNQIKEINFDKSNKTISYCKIFISKNIKN